LIPFSIFCISPWGREREREWVEVGVEIEEEEVRREEDGDDDRREKIVDLRHVESDHRIEDEVLLSLDPTRTWDDC